MQEKTKLAITVVLVALIAIASHFMWKWYINWQVEPATTSINTDAEELCEVQKQDGNGGLYIDEQHSGQYWYMVVQTESGLKVLAPCK